MSVAHGTWGKNDKILKAITHDVTVLPVPKNRGVSSAQI